MKVLLDTSFLLPFIQVEPDNFSAQQLKELLDRKDHLFTYSDLSIFELVAKGMKICLNSALTVDDIHKGIDSLIYRSPLHSINWISHPQLMELTFKIRKIHSDTIDCLIFSTALYNTDCFATIDHTLIEKLKQNMELYNEIISINPRFYVWNKDLTHPPVLFSRKESRTE
jgi:PIN domain nuclease of toxin-antitoxin system